MDWKRRSRESKHLEGKGLLRPGIGKKKGLYKSPGLGRKITIETGNCEEKKPVQESGLGFGRKRSRESRALEEKSPTCLSYDCRKMIEARGVRFFIGPRSPPPSPRLHKNGWLGVGRGREELIPPMSDVWMCLCDTWVLCVYCVGAKGRGRHSFLLYM